MFKSYLFVVCLLFSFGKTLRIQVLYQMYDFQSFFLGLFILWLIFFNSHRYSQSLFLNIVTLVFLQNLASKLFFRQDWSCSLFRTKYSPPLRQDPSLYSLQYLVNHEVFQLTVGIRHYTKSLGNCISSLFGGSFQQPWVVSFNKCVHQYVAKHLRRSLKISSLLCYFAEQLQLFCYPSPDFSAQGGYLDLPGFHLFFPWPGNSLMAASWVNTEFTSFISDSAG